MDWLGYDQAYVSLFPYPLSMTLFNRGQARFVTEYKNNKQEKVTRASSHAGLL